MYGLDGTGSFHIIFFRNGTCCSLSDYFYSQNLTIMKLSSCILTLAAILFSCQGSQPSGSMMGSEIVYLPRDREIVEETLARFSETAKSEKGALMVKVARSFLETPYVANTLEVADSEKLVVNLREMDCTTFAENCLALVRTLQQKNPGFESFTAELEKIRYREGIRNGYPSRLHYFSDWIHDNDQKGIVKSVSQEIAHILLPNQVNFMSTHSQQYPVLKSHPELIPQIVLQEYSITNRKAWYIPRNKLPDYESELQDGDIVGITTSIEGLDVVHVVIVWRMNGKVRFIHASSKENRVVVSKETLAEYLKGSKMATGIMVARPL